MGIGSPSRISERKLREGAQLKRKVKIRRNSASLPSKWPASSTKNEQDKESGERKKELRGGGMQTKGKHGEGRMEKVNQGN